MPQPAVAHQMQAARALIFTPQKEEAFGQTIIEAQACGTPVIVNDLGANRELLSVGVSGYLIKDKAELVDSLTKIAQLSRVDCRRFAEDFDVHTMAASYENLYLSLLHR